MHLVRISAIGSVADWQLLVLEGRMQTIRFYFKQRQVSAALSRPGTQDLAIGKKCRPIQSYVYHPGQDRGV